MFLTSCTHCGASMEVPDPYSGKNIRCSTCEAEFPAFRPDERPFSFDCPECEGSIEAEPSMSGQSAPCPHCKNTIVVPHLASKLPIHPPPASAPPPPPPKPSTPRQNATFFYIFRDGKNVEGPIPTDRISRMVETRELDPSAMACIAGTDSWKPLSRVTELNLSPLDPPRPEITANPAVIPKSSPQVTATPSFGLSPSSLFRVGMVLAVVGAVVLIGTPIVANHAYEEKIAAQELVMAGILDEVARSARTMDVRRVERQTLRIEEQTDMVRAWLRQRDERKQTGKLVGVMMLVVGVGLAIRARSLQRK